MFFTKLLLKAKHKPYNFKYVIKKKLFSFLYPNEVRNALMLKKKKFVFYKLIHQKTKKLNSPSFYATTKLKKLFKHYHLMLTNFNQYDFLNK